MVLNLSPLATHLQESLTSLRFATKVGGVCVLLWMRDSDRLMIGEQHDDWDSKEASQDVVRGDVTVHCIPTCETYLGRSRRSLGYFMYY